MTPLRRRNLRLCVLVVLWVICFQFATYVQACWEAKPLAFTGAFKCTRNLRWFMQLAAPSMLGLAVALGGGWWVLRLGRAIAALSVVAVLDLLLFEWLPFWGRLSSTTLLAMLLPALLVSSGLLSILRWWKGWRLSVSDAPNSHQLSQGTRFVLRDVFEIVSLAAVTCGAVRFCWSDAHVSDITHDLVTVMPRYLGLYCWPTVCLVALVPLLLFSRAERWMWLGPPLVTAISLAWLWANGYASFNATPIIRDIGDALSLLAILGAALLVLRWAGYRLVCSTGGELGGACADRPNGRFTVAHSPHPA